MQMRRGKGGEVEPGIICDVIMDFFVLFCICIQNQLVNYRNQDEPSIMWTGSLYFHVSIWEQLVLLIGFTLAQTLFIRNA